MLEQNRHYFWNQQHKISKKQEMNFIMMQSSVITLKSFKSFICLDAVQSQKTTLRATE